jgi:drug/metabolite transporter (DMT)-like permease
MRQTDSPPARHNPYVHCVDARFAAILLAVLGYSILNLTQAVQKIGLHVRDDDRTKGTLIWLAATVSASLSVLLVYAAISLASVSMVGALAGTGLIALALFTSFWMHESLALRHIIAIGAIAGGAVLVGLYDSSSSGDADMALLYGLLAGGALIGGLLWLLTGRSRIRAVVIGAFAGFLGSYAQLFQNISTTGAELSDGVILFLVTTLGNPITLIWVALSLSSVVVIQFAYKHGDAIQIIPVFTSAFILTPVAGGVLVFDESLVVLQFAGIALIVAGTIVLGRRGTPT